MKMRDYSNYHNTSMNEKIIHDGNLIFEYGLDGFESHEVVINNINTKALIYSSFSDKSGTKRSIVGRLSDIEIGRLVTWGTENWLIINKPDDNKIYRKATIQLCNHSLTLSGTQTCQIVAYNDFDEPIEECTSSSPLLIPCIVERTIVTTGTDEAINLPEGRVNLTIPFTVHEEIAIGKTVILYNEEYVIRDIDYTKSNGNSGLLILHGKKEVK